MDPRYRSANPPVTVPLSIGASAVAKAFATIVGLVGVVMALFFVLVTFFAGGVLDYLAANADDLGPPAPGDPGTEIVSQASAITPYLRIGGLVCALPIALFFVYLMVRVLRSRAWLTGSVVAKRGAFTTKRVDLAGAEVKGDTVTHTQTHGNYRYIYTIAAVAARDPQTGTSVKIPLRGQGLKRLPANELIALADAIMAARRPQEPGYASAATIAEALHGMAANPFPV